MISYSKLTKEIIWLIFNFLHLAQDDLFSYPSKFKLSQTLNIEYFDPGLIQHHLYSAKLETLDFKFQYLLVNLSLNSESEFILLFQVNNLPIYRIDYLLDFPKEIYIYQNNIWKITPLKTQLILINGFQTIEIIINSGISWQINSLDEYLYRLLISILEKKISS